MRIFTKRKTEGLSTFNTKVTNKPDAEDILHQIMDATEIQYDCTKKLCEFQGHPALTNLGKVLEGRLKHSLSTEARIQMDKAIENIESIKNERDPYFRQYWQTKLTMAKIILGEPLDNTND